MTKRRILHGQRTISVLQNPQIAVCLVVRGVCDGLPLLTAKSVEGFSESVYLFLRRFVEFSFALRFPEKQADFWLPSGCKIFLLLHENLPMPMQGILCFLFNYSSIINQNTICIGRVRECVCVCVWITIWYFSGFTLNTNYKTLRFGKSKLSWRSGLIVGYTFFCSNMHSVGPTVEYSLIYHSLRYHFTKKKKKKKKKKKAKNFSSSSMNFKEWPQLCLKFIYLFCLSVCDPTGDLVYLNQSVHSPFWHNVTFLSNTNGFRTYLFVLWIAS